MSDDYHFFPGSLFWKDLEEFKEYILFDLDRDAVCFDGLVTYPRNGLRFFGDELTDALRQCLVCLMEAGAVPAEFGTEFGYYWLRVPNYGTEPQEIVDNIIKEWLEKGGGVPDPMGLWFITPDNCGPTRDEAEQEMREDE